MGILHVALFLGLMVTSLRSQTAASPSPQPSSGTDLLKNIFRHPYQFDKFQQRLTLLQSSTNAAAEYYNSVAGRKKAPWFLTFLAERADAVAVALKPENPDDFERLFILSFGVSTLLRVEGVITRNQPHALPPLRLFNHRQKAGLGNRLTPTNRRNHVARQILLLYCQFYEGFKPRRAAAFIASRSPLDEFCPYSDELAHFIDEELVAASEIPTMSPPAATPKAPSPPVAQPVRYTLPGLAVLAGAGLLLGWRRWRKRTIPTATPATHPAAGGHTSITEGVQLPERYEGAREIGRGGMGIVFAARDRMLDRDVAVKALRPELRHTNEGQTRFLREARALAALRHPNILTIFDVQTDPWPLFSMELLAGQSLAEVVENGPLEDESFFRLARDLLGAIDYAQSKGIVHRDVKPSNVFVRTDGTALLVDFGLVASATDTSLTKVGQVLGTLDYMSPEQMSGAAVDSRTDIFAAALTLHYALAGKLPAELPQRTHHVSLDPAALGAKRGNALVPVLSRALAVNPSERYPKAGAFLGDLLIVQQELKKEEGDVKGVLDRLEELRAAPLHSLTGKFAMAQFLEGEPDRFRMAFLNVQTLSAIDEHLQALLVILGELAGHRLRQSTLTELAPLRELLGALVGERVFFEKLSQTFAKLKARIEDPSASLPSGDLQSKAVVLARQFKTWNTRIAGVIGTYNIDPVGLLEQKAQSYTARGMVFSQQVDGNPQWFTISAPQLSADLERVFDCILENSFQAHAKTLLANWRCVAAGPCLELDDDGDGVTPEVVAKLAHAPFSTKTMGTGTGLAASRDLLARHRAVLKIAPRPEGGTRITISMG